MTSGWLVGAAIPALTFFVMVVVGTDLTADDFMRVNRRVVVTATLAQIVLLPLLSAAVVLVLDPPLAVAAGLILIAACPAGPASSAYTYLAGARTVLAVTLTAASCAASIVSLPLLTGVGFRLLLADAQRIDVPIMLLSGQLVVLVFVPVGLGMLARARWPAWIAARGAALQAVGLAFTVALVMGVAYAEVGVLVRHVASIATGAGLFTVLAMIAGWLLGRALSDASADHFAMMIQFTSRSLAIATVVGATLLGHREFVAMAAAFLVVRSAIVLAAVGAYRLLAARTAPPRDGAGSMRGSPSISGAP